MAVPVFQTKGTLLANAAGGTPGAPAGVVADDILLMWVQAENEAVTLSSAQGFAEVFTQFGLGTPGAGGNLLAVYWKRAVGGDTMPTIADPGDHAVAKVLRFSGCKTTGNPWNGTPSTVTEATADTSYTIVAGDGGGSTSTTVNDCLVVAFFCTSRNATSSAEFSAFADANLASVAEIDDDLHTVGAGGGCGVGTGELATAGAIGTFTATGVTSLGNKCNAMIALEPPAAVDLPPRPTLINYAPTRAWTW